MDSSGVTCPEVVDVGRVQWMTTHFGKSPLMLTTGLSLS